MITIGSAKAQVVERPLHSYNPVKQVIKRENTAAQRNSSLVSLPFFDDFSSNVGMPDPLLWQSNGGVLTSNEFCVNPPTLNVAVFDGMNANGVSYSNISTENGPTDSLISLPINLSGLSAAEAESVFLSFFWQAGGKSFTFEPSHPRDSITLQFKNANGQWRTQWRRVPPSSGSERTAPFAQVMLKVTTDYQHPNFQFRFIANGRRNGSFDMWSVDYVNLDKNRFAADTSYADLALSQTPGSLFKNYYAIPYEHFTTSLIVDTVVTILRNLRSSLSAFSIDFRVKDRDNSILIDLPSGAGNIVGSDLLAEPNRVARKLTVENNKLILPTSFTRVDTLTYRFALAEDVNANRFTRNDTVTNRSILDNYYAFDDGTPEIIQEHSGNNARIAWKFSINQLDTLTAIAVYLPKLYPSGPTQAKIKPRIWTALKGIDGASADVIKLNFGQRDINYSAMKDSLMVFDLRDSSFQKRLISGDVYIGWENGAIVNQSVKVAFGADASTTYYQKMYVSTNSSWFVSNRYEPVSMVRAIFGHERPVTGLFSQKSNLQGRVYPNPATDKVKVEFSDNQQIKQIYLLNLLGQTVDSWTFSERSASAEIDLNSVLQGVYLLKIVTESGIVTHKIVKN